VDGCDPALGDLPEAEGRFAGLDRIDTLEPYDFLLVSTPLRRTPEILEELLRARPRGVVVEIASIKSHLSETLDRAAANGTTVCSLHPMFGPGKSIYEPLTFVLACRRPPEQERESLAPLLQHPYTHLITIPFAHHDQLMGWLLGLAHLTGMLFGTAIAASGLSGDELQACASTTFARQAETARSILSEDSALYFDIQELNPHREAVYRAAGEALGRLVDVVGRGDLAGFRSVLEGARRSLGVNP